MEIKPIGSRIEDLYAKAKVNNFFRKPSEKNFLEELSERLGPRLASASPVKPESLNPAPAKAAPVNIQPPAAEKAGPGPAMAEADMTDPVKAGPVQSEAVKAAPAEGGSAEGAPMKAEPQKSEPARPAPFRTVPQRILLVKDEPIVIEPARTAPAKAEPAKVGPVNIALLKTELLKGQPARVEPAAGESAKAAPAITEPVEYVVKEGDSLWKIGRQLFKTDPYRIARDNGITNPNLIRPGQKLIINPPPPQAEPPRLAGEVTASWYGVDHHNKLTASGQRFDMHQNTLAHKTLPLGTKVRLLNPDNGRFTEGVVTDRGPYIKGRDVDLSYAMAKKLGFVKKGVTKLDIETI